MDDDPSPPPSHHGFDLIRLWQGERDRRSPSPSPPVTRPSLFGGSRDRDRRSLPSRSRLNRNRPREEDRGLRHILEMSRMEYEADQQLNKGEYGRERKRKRKREREREIERERESKYVNER